MLFPAETTPQIYRHSRGIPRLINTVCENALITAYARQLETISPEIIDEVAADLRLGVVHEAPRRRRARRRCVGTRSAAAQNQLKKSGWR